MSRLTGVSPSDDEARSSSARPSLNRRPTSQLSSPVASFSPRLPSPPALPIVTAPGAISRPDDERVSSFFHDTNDTPEASTSARSSTDEWKLDFSTPSSPALTSSSRGVSSSPEQRARKAQNEYGELEVSSPHDEDGDWTPMLGGSSESEEGNYPPKWRGRGRRKRKLGETCWACVHSKVGALTALVGLVALGLLVLKREHVEAVKDYASSRLGYDPPDERLEDEDSVLGQLPEEGYEPPQEIWPTQGEDGSIIRMENGKTFVYKNRYGGSWDSSFGGKAARAQNFTPPLSEPWDYSIDTISGVNLGGWLTLEPFISPALFEPFVNAPVPAVDEWTLSQNLGDRLAEVLEEHYRTFITEEDFALIADAGLSWVRIPLPFWSVDSQEGEPFLAYSSWKYFLKAVDWARKYGLRINLDLHTVPGSQNGWNHSGKMGAINFLHGVMGVANAQRSLNIMRLLTEFIMLPGNTEVIPMFGVLNEPFAADIGADTLRRFYFHAYDMIRNITGFGTGNGPMIAYHDGFVNPIKWYGFMDGADRLALDSHFYLAFATPNQDNLDHQAVKPCKKWATINDCGLFVNGIEGGSRYEDAYGQENEVGVSPCAEWMDTDTWDDELKLGMHKFAYAYMDTTRDWFFWTWKTGVSLATGKEANPMWSYSRGLREGYMPYDPRRGAGFCKSHAIEMGLKPPRMHWQGKFQPYNTGGDPTPTVAAAESRKWGQFPGPTLADLRVEVLPSLTPTGRPHGFPKVGSEAGEVAKSERTPSPEPREGPADWYAEVKGCAYVGGWEGNNVDVPVTRCTGV